MAEKIEAENTVTQEVAVAEEVAEEAKPAKKIESLESALRRFKRQSSGIISEVRKREAYDKPSVKRKKKSKEARKHKKNNKYGSGKW